MCISDHLLIIIVIKHFIFDFLPIFH